MKMIYAAVLAALLAGCSITPNVVRESGSRFEFNSANRPEAVARCITRNAREFGNFLTAPATATFVPVEAAGAYEVTVLQGGSGYTMAMADVSPAGSGSAVVVTIQPYWAMGRHETTARAFVKGC